MFQFFKLSFMNKLFYAIIISFLILIPCTQVHSQESHTLNYLYEISGNRTIAGQHGMQYRETINTITGYYPGLWGEDFSFYSKYSTSSISQWRSLLVEKAKEMWAKGDIIALMFHACPPTQPEPCGWSGGVQSHLTDSQWDELITNGTRLNKNWKARLDAIVPYLQELQNSGVEVLFRPLHEMNQGAFWWGGRPGPNGTARLYQITHDYLESKGLTNIIWVWSLQDFGTLSSDINTYDPGSKYWDVLALDVYWSDGTGYTTQKYNIIKNKAAGKPIAIGECGKLPTADILAKQPLWTYFMDWAELTQQDNSNAAISSLYNASNILTEDDMPGWNKDCSYLGKPYRIPGKIEAENYDNCGEGISYHDFDKLNEGGKYRIKEGVDIDTSSEGGYMVTDVHSGEWLKYTVIVDTSGIYNIQTRVSSAESGKTFHIEMGNVNISGSIMVPNTSSNKSWVDVNVSTPELTSGMKIMRIVMDSDSFNIDYVKFTLKNQAPTISIASPTNGESFATPVNIKIKASATDDGVISKVEFFDDDKSLGEIDNAPYEYLWNNAPKGNHILSAVATDNAGLSTISDKVIIKVIQTEMPYDSIPYPIPGRIEAENYDYGEENVAFYDLSKGNFLNAYRNDDVDIGICTDTTGGYALGFFQTGEWVQYTVNVTKTQDYDIEFRVASKSPPTASISLDVDGKDVTGPITVSTGGVQEWKSIVKTNIPLKAGKRILRLNSLAQYPNVNYMDFTASSASGVSDTVAQQPRTFRLSQNYPNPFNPTTIIKYEIPKTCFVTIKIYDLIGRELKTLVHEEKSAGDYSESFDGKDLSSGVYFYSIRAGDFYKVRQMVLLK